MKKHTETIFTDATGKHHLVTVRDNETPLVLTPKSGEEAGVVWDALKHIESGYRSRLAETTPVPFKRRVWYTDSGKVLIGERQGGLEVYCYGLTAQEVNELQTALAEAQVAQADAKAATPATRAEALKEAA
jgi:hypothetical protein